VLETIADAKNLRERFLHTAEDVLLVRGVVELGRMSQTDGSLCSGYVRSLERPIHTHLNFTRFPRLCYLITNTELNSFDHVLPVLRADTTW
jgi:hypothetical protein